MEKSAFLVTSDNVLRYGSRERRIVKHCIEIECFQNNCKNGGIGFGYNGSYIRYAGTATFPGTSNVDFIAKQDFKVPLVDRIMICMANTKNENSFTVIHQETKRIHTFKFIKNIDKIRLITYLTSSSTSKETLVVFTLKNEFKNILPIGYNGWEDLDIKTINLQKQPKF